METKDLEQSALKQAKAEVLGQPYATIQQQKERNKELRKKILLSVTAQLDKGDAWRVAEALKKVEVLDKEFKRLHSAEIQISNRITPQQSESINGRKNQILRESQKVVQREATRELENAKLKYAVFVNGVSQSIRRRGV